ncbi:outer dense fiber protein 3-like protein 2 [Tupaia chinensis]|uniref:outer dense fiber protein 3-like protein 2 n=1 Tax=Tupaia chinensis TaxID=246437 RepID=UPI000FFBF100|nr:outer dense fiber protein 3-like protein 2 [Tupaia chinensis]
MVSMCSGKNKASLQLQPPGCQAETQGHSLTPLSPSPTHLACWQTLQALASKSSPRSSLPVPGPPHIHGHLYLWFLVPGLACSPPPGLPVPHRLFSLKPPEGVGEHHIRSLQGCERLSEVPPLFTSDHVPPCLGFPMAPPASQNPHVSWKPPSTGGQEGNCDTERKRLQRSLQVLIPGSGPGSCLLPSAVGRFNQDCTRVASPACSRTRKSGEAPPPDCSPGPIYLLDPKVTRFGRSCTPAYSMQGRGKTRGLEVTPGPGAYSPEKAPPVHQRTPPAFSLGSRLRPRPRDTSAPAPNAYTMPPLWGSQVFIKPSYPSYSVVGRTAPARPPQDPAEIPGPGQYNSPDPNTYRQRWPAFTMLGRPRAPRPLDETPGPGTHSPEQVTVNKARAPAYTMGIRHSTRAATVRPASPRAPSHRQLPPPRRPPALGGPSLRLEGEARRASGVAAPSFPGSELSEVLLSHLIPGAVTSALCGSRSFRCPRTRCPAPTGLGSPPEHGFLLLTELSGDSESGRQQP